jgi:hypothetical protein
MIMKKNLKITAILMALTIIFSSAVFAYGKEVYTTDDLNTLAKGVIDNKKSDVGVTDNLLSQKYLDNAGSGANDWYPIAMSRLGVEDDYSAYLAVLKTYVEKAYKTQNKLSKYKVTEWHRIALCVLACGGNPESFGKDKNGNNINLIADGIYNRSDENSIGVQGINGWIWALITLDADDFKVPENAETTGEKIIEEILQAQNSDGGWSLTGDTSDVDLSAMALQALSNHQNNSQVKKSVNKCLAYLSKVQLSSGGFESSGTENSESCSQVIIALTALGISPYQDNRFIKKNHSVVDALMAYKCKDGGFAHSFKSDSNNPDAVAGQSNSMAGEQALLAIASLIRFNQGGNSLYNFRDASVVNSKLTNEDIKSIDALPENLTTENYGEICTLLYKAENSNNSKYTKILLKKKEEIENIITTIDKINSQIADLTAVEDITLWESDKVDNVISLYDTLSEYDKTKVNGYDDVTAISAKIKEQARNMIVFAVLIIILAVIVVFVLIRIKQRKRKKHLESIIEAD